MKSVRWSLPDGRLFLTCSSRQHTGPSSHFEPQRLTSFSRTGSSGWCASPLSGQGSSPPKMDFFPQWPRIAQRPCSWILVSPCAPTSDGCRAREPNPTTVAMKPKRRILPGKQSIKKHQLYQPPFHSLSASRASGIGNRPCTSSCAWGRSRGVGAREFAGQGARRG